jgi:signal transduction histidine kinase
MEPEARFLNQLLALKSNPRVAGALRGRKESIVRRWEEAVREMLPKADELTTKQVRDTIPIVIDQMIRTLESTDTGELQQFFTLSRQHGVVRFNEAYSVRELVIEYRLLRAIMLDEVHAGLREAKVEGAGPELIAINMAVDIALQQAVVAFVDYQAQKLKGAAEAESKYLSFLSHDLRNNLNNITLTLELLVMRLKGMPEFSEEHESLVAARQSIWETMEGMERLMHAERLKRQAIQPKFSAVKVRELVEKIVVPLRRRAEEKGLGLENKVPAEVVINSDEQLLTLVVQNLVGNGLKYTDKGGVTVDLVKGEATGGRYVLTVRDTGRGIAAEDRAKLFEAFSRGETHGESGAGLGLAIASAAARLLGAELGVDSEVGRGTVFQVKFPEEAGEV